MSFIMHSVIVVTTFTHEHALQFMGAAEQEGVHITAVHPSKVNKFFTMLVPPDGSNEGWPESEVGNLRRAALVRWLRKQTYDDGSSPFSWVELEYGSDAREATIVATAWDAT